MSAPGARGAGSAVPPRLPRFAAVAHLSEVDSTNDEAAALARDGAADGLVVVADHQRRGRGRRGRSWESPPGAGLLASVVLRGAGVDLITVAAGLAVVDACRSVCGVDVGLKWPNDIVVPERGLSTREGGGADHHVGHRKLGGILAEVVTDTVAGHTVVVGLGLNLRWPDGVDRPVGSCSLAEMVPGGMTVERDALLRAWLDAFEFRLAQDAAALVDDYRAACTTIGRSVRVDLPSAERPSRTVEGVATGVDHQGRLIVGDQTIDAGDVILLR